MPLNFALSNVKHLGIALANIDHKTPVRVDPRAVDLLPQPLATVGDLFNLSAWPPDNADDVVALNVVV